MGSVTKGFTFNHCQITGDLLCLLNSGGDAEVSWQLASASRQLW